MLRLLTAASLLLCLVSSAEAATSEKVTAGVQAATLAAAGANPKNPLIDLICPLMQAEAEAEGIPPMLFVRLIWRESRFNPHAISPKGAQGIAQFMPTTAEERGLENPFDPQSAIAHSARLLADLTRDLGNIGLATAAYNAGADRVRNWLAGGLTHLPFETEAYVSFVTGRFVDDWKNPATQVPDSLKRQDKSVQDACRKLAPSVVRAIYAPDTEPVIASGPYQPWGVELASDFSQQRALARFARLKQRYGELLGEINPMVRGERNLSRGRRQLVSVQIGVDSRDVAEKLCARLRSEGGACIVQKN